MAFPPLLGNHYPSQETAAASVQPTRQAARQDVVREGEERDDDLASSAKSQNNEEVWDARESPRSGTFKLLAIITVKYEVYYVLNLILFNVVVLFWVAYSATLYARYQMDRYNGVRLNFSCALTVVISCLTNHKSSKMARHIFHPILFHFYFSFQNCASTGSGGMRIYNKICYLSSVWYFWSVPNPLVTTKGHEMEDFPMKILRFSGPLSSETTFRPSGRESRGMILVAALGYYTLVVLLVMAVHEKQRVSSLGHENRLFLWRIWLQNPRVGRFGCHAHGPVI